jgi:hypothetical protein
MVRFRPSVRPFLVFVNIWFFAPFADFAGGCSFRNRPKEWPMAEGGGGDGERQGAENENLPGLT